MRYALGYNGIYSGDILGLPYRLQESDEKQVLSRHSIPARQHGSDTTKRKSYGSALIKASCTISPAVLAVASKPGSHCAMIDLGVKCQGRRSCVGVHSCRYQLWKFSCVQSIECRTRRMQELQFQELGPRQIVSRCGRTSLPASRTFPLIDVVRSLGKCAKGELACPSLAISCLSHVLYNAITLFVT